MYTRSLIQTGAPDLCLLTRFHFFTLKRMLYFWHQKQENKNPALSDFAWVSQKGRILYIRLGTTSSSLRGAWDFSQSHSVLDGFEITQSVTCQKACPLGDFVFPCIYMDVTAVAICMATYIFKVKPSPYTEHVSLQKGRHISEMY